jgi:Protein of unknown function (DUF2752)
MTWYWRAGLVTLLFAGFALYDAPVEPKFHVCGFLWLTGLPCPFCGMTRALCFLMKGQFSQAIQLHALSPVAAVTLAVLGVRQTLPAWSWKVLGATFLIYGASRVLFAV